MSKTLSRSGQRLLAQSCVCNIQRHLVDSQTWEVRVSVVQPVSRFRVPHGHAAVCHCQWVFFHWAPCQIAVVHILHCSRSTQLESVLCLWSLVACSLCPRCNNVLSQYRHAQGTRHFRMCAESHTNLPLPKWDILNFEVSAVPSCHKDRFDCIVLGY